MTAPTVAVAARQWFVCLKTRPKLDFLLWLEPYYKIRLQGIGMKEITLENLSSKGRILSQYIYIYIYTLYSSNVMGKFNKTLYTRYLLLPVRYPCKIYIPLNPSHTTNPQ